jgi:FHS family L-fucose permease-like MFS transporter
LLALFVIASGIICLEIAAGAFIVLAGPAESSAFRINLAQAFNGLGAVVGPIIGGNTGRLRFDRAELPPHRGLWRRG